MLLLAFFIFLVLCMAYGVWSYWDEKHKRALTAELYIKQAQSYQYTPSIAENIEKYLIMLFVGSNLLIIAIIYRNMNL